MSPSASATAVAKARTFLRRHGMLVAVLLGLSIIAAVMQSNLGATLVTVDSVFRLPRPDPESVYAKPCSSSGSLFDANVDVNMNDPDFVMRKYRGLAGGAFTEREESLSKPSSWTCNAPSFEEMMPETPALTEIASGLGGWEEGITFANFSSIMMELQRVYECKLTEMQMNATTIVFYQGTDAQDEDDPAGSLYELPRVDELVTKLDEEKKISRIAMERTLLALRSAELMAPFTVEMYCLQLETMDVRLAMSLLADTASCMPKIWDITTSLHDRDGE